MKKNGGKIEINTQWLKTVKAVTISEEHGTYSSYQAVIRTLGVDMILSHGDYIIKDEQGEFYPCKPDIFEETYELAEYKGAIKMNFEEVLPLLKQGKKALRSGWNGKGMFVVRQKGYPEGIKCNKQTAEAWNLNEGDLFKVHPYLQIKNADGTHAMWVPSIGDIFAEDWEIVE